MSGNVVVGAGLRIKRYERARVCSNVIADGRLSLDECTHVDQEDNRILADKALPEAKVVLLPNKYDPRRAHLAIYNPMGANRIDVVLSSFLQPGDRYRFVHPEDLFGEPILAGVFDGNAVRVAMDSPFVALVLLRD